MHSHPFVLPDFNYELAEKVFSQNIGRQINIPFTKTTPTMKKKFLIICLLAIFHQIKAQDSIAFIDKIPVLENGFYLHDETHFLKSGKTVDTELLKFYILKRNVRNVFIEAGHSTAYLMNQYIETGNDEWLCKIVPAKKHPNFLFFLKNARKIFEQKKFKFFGIDQYSIDSEELYHTSPHAKEYRNNPHFRTLFRANRTFNKLLQFFKLKKLHNIK